MALRSEAAAAVIDSFPASNAEQQIRECVTRALGGANSKTVVRERRRDRRYPYPHPVYLTPLDEHDAPAGSTIVVLGKHLSERGLDFYYDEPIPSRRVLVSLEVPGGRQVSLVMVLTWCRFARHGWYENGGRFLKAAPAMKNPPASEARSA
jgi:hypothetical protein